MKEYQVDNEKAGMRLDQYLIELLVQSRSQIQKDIREGHITVNGQKVKSGYALKKGDQIAVTLIEETTDVVGEPMDLDIIYEDDTLLVINKENGIVVHPGAGNSHGTLVNGLLNYASQWSDVNGTFRPGIVHRIDADTTGLLVVAKTNAAHMALAKQLQEKTTHRKYIALVWGLVQSDTGTIHAPIGRDNKNRKKMAVTAHNSKDAITHFKVLDRFSNASLVELTLETGRTHQIRVHMDYIGHPVVNDPVYGNHPLIDDTGQCLHAKELGFVHPQTGKYMEFSCSLPPCFIKIMNHLQDAKG